MNVGSKKMAHSYISDLIGENSRKETMYLKKINYLPCPNNALDSVNIYYYPALKVRGRKKKKKPARRVSYMCLERGIEIIDSRE